MSDHEILVISDDESSPNVPIITQPFISIRGKRQDTDPKMSTQAPKVIPDSQPIQEPLQSQAMDLVEGDGVPKSPTRGLAPHPMILYNKIMDYVPPAPNLQSATMCYITTIQLYRTPSLIYPSLNFQLLIPGIN